MPLMRSAKMNELLDLEPRETDADELDVDTAFSGIAEASRDHSQCLHCCGDDVSHWFFATSIPW
jgi:hypothetical protein